MGLGGGSNKAQKQAAEQEQQRSADISKSISGINAAFDSPGRLAEYDQQAKDVTKFYTDDVNRQQAIAARKQKFALARSGQIGSSQQAYQGKVLGEDYSKAIIDATRRGQNAAASLRASDEQSRQSLIGMAESGIDAGTTSAQATRSLQSNLLSSESTATADNIGNLFSDLGGTYQQSQDAKAARQGQLYGFGGLFANTTPQAAGTSPQY